MKKLVSFFSMVCILNVLAIGGLAGFLWGTGRLDKVKAQAIGDMLKQRGTPEGLREKVYDLLVPVATTGPATTTAPASEPALAEGDGLEPATAAERVDYTRRVLEEQRLRLEDQAQDVRHRQELLVRMQGELDKKSKDLKEKEDAYEQKILAASSKKDGTGFETTMALFEEMKPKQVKDLLGGMAQDEAVKYLTAMEPDRAAKIVGEFKTADEKTFIGGVLDKIRGGSGGSGSGSGGGGAGAPAIGTGAASGSGTGGGALQASASAAPSVKAGH